MNILTNYLHLSLKVSRVRFWLYLGGTYLIGYALGLPTGDFNSILNVEFFLFLLYFFIPANIFLYGINDYFDYDTDQYNPKKDEKEFRSEKENRKTLQNILTLMIMISLGALLIQKNWIEQLIFIIFLLLSFFYSAPPLRFKSRPFFDFLSNILYGFPAIFGFYQSSGQFPDLLAIVAISAWTGAMHLFSAVPDIEYDKKAKVITSAVFIGKKWSLIICFVLWSIFSLIILSIVEVFPLSLLVLIYPLVPLMLLIKENLDINKIYWYFPSLNGILGFLAFLTVMIIKIPFI